MQMVITPEQRKEVLGRLAEFEMRLMDLTPLQANFVLAILRKPDNQANAAEIAGYAKASAKIKGSQLMANPKIQAAIAAGQLLREDRTMVTSERTLNELAIIAFSNIGDYTVEPGSNEVSTKPGVPEYALRAVQSAEYVTTVSENQQGVTTVYKVKIKLWSKTDALRMLALYQKLINGAGEAGNITINDNRGQIHKHEHNTWQVGDKKITF